MRKGGRIGALCFPPSLSSLLVARGRVSDLIRGGLSVFGGKQAGCIFVARRSMHALILSSSLSRSSAICHCDLKRSRAAPTSFLKSFRSSQIICTYINDANAPRFPIGVRRACIRQLYPEEGEGRAQINPPENDKWPTSIPALLILELGRLRLCSC